MENKKTQFEVRQVDSWFYDECWNYNASYFLFNFSTCAKNEKKAFTQALK